jgi:hypothetical protein
VVSGARVTSLFVVADGPAARVDRLDPGSYTVCIIPLSQDYRDPEFQRTLQPDINRLETHCVGTRVAADPELQPLQIEVPPMRLLE